MKMIEYTIYIMFYTVHGSFTVTVFDSSLIETNTCKNAKAFGKIIHNYTIKCNQIYNTKRT